MYLSKQLIVLLEICLDAMAVVRARAWAVLNGCKMSATNDNLNMPLLLVQFGRRFTGTFCTDSVLELQYAQVAAIRTDTMDT